VDQKSLGTTALDEEQRRATDTDRAASVSAIIIAFIVLGIFWNVFSFPLSRNIRHKSLFENRFLMKGLLPWL
jgi:hypothetical protein